MNGEQQMTKTEAHPYHQGRGCKVFDPNCPLCRDDPNRETTYVSWSLHQAALTARDAALERVRVLANEVRASRVFLHEFGMLRPGLIHEDSLMYEDARRATDAANALGGEQ